ncbi:MAG: hypothetical protein ACJ8F3_21035 [Xanthobacteraceae bacterium]
MLYHCCGRMTRLGAAAALAIASATPAAAGCCVGGEFTLVNQGPVYSGPGHFLPRQLHDWAPPAYPYVGPVFTGYPYGLQSSGGYPRGFHSPFTGYPYVEPPYGVPAPSYVNYRMGEPAGIYRRRR